ncbi:MAG: ribosome assembly factor SBDS [Candidatus Altiarchaeales archaeon HGW-Altiarchaeales-3]|nr:MAG: ribosome assembly factor SBDS [Candidatus Altiarchaeales archaeon HGW-Altiarchaeales-3]
MIPLDQATTIKLKTHGETFEILVDPDMSLEFREGKEIDINEILAIDTIFKDANAGDRASDESMLKVFETTDVKIIATKILKKGELHLTTDQKKRIMNERKRQIINIIARNAINPQTKTPHPPERIESAIAEAKFHVEINKSAKEQVDKVVKAIRPILPIKFDNVRIAVKIPAEYSGKLYAALHEFGTIKKDEWHGNFQMCLIEMPAGLQDDFCNRVNNITRGDAEIRILR